MKKIITSIAFIVGVGLLYTALSAGVRPISLIILHRIPFEQQTIMLQVMLPLFANIIAGIIALAVVIFIIKLRKQSIKEALYINKTVGKNIRIAILLGALIGLLSISYNVAALFSVDSEMFALTVQYPEFMLIVRSTILSMFTGLLPAIVPIICRELILRGAMFSEARKHTDGIRSIIALSVVPAILGVILVLFLSNFSLNLSWGISFLTELVVLFTLYALCYRANSIWAPVAASLTISSFGSINSGLEAIMRINRRWSFTAEEAFASVFNPRAGFPVPQGIPLFVRTLFVLVIIAVISLILWRMLAEKNAIEKETLG